MIDKVKEKHSSLEFFAIDVDQFRGLCSRYGVLSVPTVIVMYEGKEQTRIEGLVMTSAFIKVFADICNKYSANLEK